MSAHARRSVLAALALVVAAALQVTGPAGAQAAPSAAGCANRLLAATTRASEVAAKDPAAFRAAAQRNGRSETALRAEARRDPSLWLDTCGLLLFRDAQVPSGARVAAGGTASTAADPATASAPLSETFQLQSRPGASRTIFLDFRGGTVSGTAWNSSYGDPIAVEPYSITAPADTAFTDAELTQIQRTWQVVAEDYAPFDVNVTTQDPGVAAIDRSSSTDQVYGARVLITNGGPVYNGCGCGGVAYVNVFNLSGANHLYYQPAWVFSAGTGTAGKNMGEAASHEAGHNLGLHHDGTSTSGYYTGSSPWAPIMGAAYYQPMSQWSKGEYPGANSAEDDLAIIATGAPLRTDDHGGAAGSATSLSAAAPVDGVIGSRSDVDAFRFDAAGSTTLTVAPSAFMGNLDVGLTVLDASGAVVATVDPAVAATSSSQATGTGATWSVTLPPTAATYTALVDGVGSGDPATAGKYSDYGSLGNYRVTLATQAGPVAPAPLTASASTPPAATVGVAYSATPVTASGGTTPYAFTATGLPPGLAIASGTGTLSGTPTTAGSYPVTVTVTDALGATAAQTVTVVVGAPPVAVSAQTFKARLNRAFSGQLRASGGDGTYTWTGTGLPAWLKLSSAGALSGTPTKNGSYSFTVTATSAGASASATVTVQVSRK